MKIFLNSSEIQEVLKLTKADSVMFMNEGETTTIIAHDYKNMKFKNHIEKRVPSSYKNEKGATKINTKILKMLPKNEPIIITDDTITAGKRKIKYAKNDDAFKLEKIEEYLTTIDGKELKHLLSGEYALDKDDIRPSLSGICIKDNKFMALDGYRLTVREGSFKADKEVIFHKDILPILKKIKTEEGIKIYYNNKYVRFNIGELDIIGTRIEEKYINVSKVIPKEYNTKVKIKDIKELLELLKDYKKNNLQKVKFDFKDDIVKIASENEIMTVEDSFKIEKIEGDGLEIAFNVNYLIDTLNDCKDSNTIEIEMSKAVAPMIIKSENKLDLILPIRIPKSAA
ncbi:MAG: hypothetical protein WCQ76_06690 [Fusobacterium sp.]